MCIYVVRYEWDEAKNVRNQRKHAGVSFEMAALVFEDVFCLIAPDRIDPVTSEQRWHAIGAVQMEPGIAAVLLVVHVYREENNGEEIIRIVSARAAEKHEFRRYQEQAIN
jgi:uncharacterized protein